MSGELRAWSQKGDVKRGHLIGQVAVIQSHVTSIGYLPGTSGSYVQ